MYTITVHRNIIPIISLLYIGFHRELCNKNVINVVFISRFKINNRYIILLKYLTRNAFPIIEHAISWLLVMVVKFRN